MGLLLAEGIAGALGRRTILVDTFTKRPSRREAFISPFTSGAGVFGY